MAQMKSFIPRNLYGQLVVTAAINSSIAENTKMARDVLRALSRYVKQDWGDMCSEDKAMNDEVWESGIKRSPNGKIAEYLPEMDAGRLFAKYETCEGPIWIITEWDRSVTTVLFPSDY